MKKLLSVLLAILLAAGTAIYALPVLAALPEGAEDENWDVQISTKEQLLALLNMPRAAGRYTLERDINLGGAAVTPVCAFSGAFDGQGHTISNFRLLTGTDGCFGLFSCLSGVVQDLNLNAGNQTVVSVGEYPLTADGMTYWDCSMCGILAATAENGACVQDCTVTGSVSVPGNEVVFGGFVGYGNVSILRCTSSLQILLNQNTDLLIVGGLLGAAWFNSSVGTYLISDCVFDGGIATFAGTPVERPLSAGGGLHIGGVVGLVFSPEAHYVISHCSGLFDAQVTFWRSAFIAGIVSDISSDATVNSCHYNGSMTATGMQENQDIYLLGISLSDNCLDCTVSGSLAGSTYAGSMEVSVQGVRGFFGCVNYADLSVEACGTLQEAAGSVIGCSVAYGGGINYGAISASGKFNGPVYLTGAAGLNAGNQGSISFDVESSYINICGASGENAVNEQDLDININKGYCAVLGAQGNAARNEGIISVSASGEGGSTAVGANGDKAGNYADVTVNAQGTGDAVAVGALGEYAVNEANVTASSLHNSTGIGANGKDAVNRGRVTANSQGSGNADASGVTGENAVNYGDVTSTAAGAGGAGAQGASGPDTSNAGAVSATASGSGAASATGAEKYNTGTVTARAPGGFAYACGKQNENGSCNVSVSASGKDYAFAEGSSSLSAAMKGFTLNASNGGTDTLYEITPGFMITPEGYEAPCPYHRGDTYYSKTKVECGNPCIIMEYCVLHADPGAASPVVPDPPAPPEIEDPQQKEISPLTFDASLWDGETPVSSLYVTMGSISWQKQNANDTDFDMLTLRLTPSVTGNGDIPSCTFVNITLPDGLSFSPDAVILWDTLMFDAVSPQEVPVYPLYREKELTGSTMVQLNTVWPDGNATDHISLGWMLRSEKEGEIHLKNSFSGAGKDGTPYTLDFDFAEFNA
ncbi:MAG: hypothetical protein IJK40_05815, partial [Clostridia bacterium]|nr:hypothetical protein [Clostridia bacterium]